MEVTVHEFIMFVLGTMTKKEKNIWPRRISLKARQE
jgi:hypothetical protein